MVQQQHHREERVPGRRPRERPHTVHHLEPRSLTPIPLHSGAQAIEILGHLSSPFLG